jgi:hypothetical protein
MPWALRFCPRAWKPNKTTARTARAASHWRTDGEVCRMMHLEVVVLVRIELAVKHSSDPAAGTVADVGAVNPRHCRMGFGSRVACGYRHVSL